MNIFNYGLSVQTRGIIAVCSLAALLFAGDVTQSQESAAGAIAGSVHDSAGNGIADASVRLQARGETGAQEHKTDSVGNFGFSQLRAGTYILSASKGEQHSNEATLTINKGGATQRVDLILASSSNADAAQDNKEAKSEIEFSDVPSFTVAAVTDWTAAGGHGSDTSLRTSEALTRETLRLKPEVSGSAALARGGIEVEQKLRSALERSPRDLKANQQLGQYYIDQERYSDAVPLLQTAYEINGKDKENEYDLAMALMRSGHSASARDHILRLLSDGDKPQWHKLAGELDEQIGDPLSAVREFERAVKGDPSEDNYFKWGSELLHHRAIWQAKDVFESGARAYPHSTRMLTALGAALFAGAMYEEAARRLCEASDLNPNDAEPYAFMGKVEIAAPNPLPCIEARLERFAKLQPENALGNYYYAMAFWRDRGNAVNPDTIRKVEGLLKKAVEADPKCGSAYLQLGVLESSQHDFKKAADYYHRALEAQPEMTEAHYRLGIAYDRLGEKDKAADEFRLHDELEKEQAAVVNRQRREVKQFLVQVGEPAPDKPANP